MSHVEGNGVALSCVTLTLSQNSPSPPKVIAKAPLALSGATPLMLAKSQLELNGHLLTVRAFRKRRDVARKTPWKMAEKGS